VGDADFSYGCYFCHWVKLWERIMAKWALEEGLTFDIAFALKKVTIPGFRKALTEEHRTASLSGARESSLSAVNLAAARSVQKVIQTLQGRLP
jgi:hypothetical protein